MQPESDLVTARVVAQRFGVAVTTVRSWARHGCIPFLRPSRRVMRFCLADVDRAIRRAQADKAVMR